MNPIIIPLVAVVLLLMIPIVAISQGLLSQLIPLVYIIAAIGGVRYLMNLHHSHKIAELEKKREIELLSLEHLKSADQIIE